MHNPITMARGLKRPLPVEEASRAGRRGKTQGEAMLAIPATKIAMGVMVSATICIPPLYHDVLFCL
jgi:hypothetical protein